MSSKTIIAIVCLQWLAFGCSTPRPVLYPDAQLKRVRASVADNDIDICIRQADEYVRSGGGSDKALESAGVGAGTGAAVGAAGGAVLGRVGAGAAAGAAGGAAAGATRGVVHEMFRNRGPSPVYRNFVNRCLRDKGYDPIGWQ